MASFIEKNGVLYSHSSSNDDSKILSAIFKYSPFKTNAHLHREFNRISESGKSLILFNVFKDCMQCTKDDIIIDSGASEKKSLRSYLEIICLEPKMKIYVQGVKVKFNYWENLLYFPHCYKHVVKQSSSKQGKHELEIAERELKEGKFSWYKFNNFNSKQGLLILSST
jgi:hypothetical protein